MNGPTVLDLERNTSRASQSSPGSGFAETYLNMADSSSIRRAYVREEYITMDYRVLKGR